MEEQILFKLRFKDIIYNIITEGTSYNDIIRAIERKTINVKYYIINYICFNDCFQELRQLTPDSLNDFINQQSKIIEIELNRSDEIIRDLYTTFYLKTINKYIVDTFVSQLKKNYLKERTERAFRLRDKLKVNLSLLKIAEKELNQSTFLYAPSLKTSQLKKLSAIYNSQMSGTPMSLPGSSITTKDKENNIKCILCNCELTDVIYLCGICKKNYNIECVLCKKCKESKQHCHTQGFVEIKTPFDNFLKEEKEFNLKQSKTQAFKKENKTNFQGYDNYKTNVQSVGGVPL